MKLFLVHCGFYDHETGHGVYESHVNFFVAAKDFGAARQKAKNNPIFKKKKMHLDGIQELHTVDGYRITLQELNEPQEHNHITSIGYEELENIPG